MTNVFNRVLRGGRAPDDWRVAFFALPPKAGDSTDPANRRPIAISRVLHKLAAQVLHGRLKQILQERQADEQMGFMPDRGTVEALFTLATAIARSIEFIMPLFFACLDCKKAFDALEVQSVSRPCIALLAEIYGGQRGKLKDQRLFDIRREVRQGDMLSPFALQCCVKACHEKLVQSFEYQRH